MRSSIDSYTPQALLGRQKEQARKIWTISAVLVIGWLLLIFLAPVAGASGWVGISDPIYKFFSYLCHQIPERSLHIDGRPLAVCSRCFGVYFGLAAGFVAYPLLRAVDDIEPPPRIWLFLSLVPIGIDWSLGIFGIWENNHLSRFVTGTILGAACAVFIIPALVEIGRYFGERKKMGASLSDPPGTAK